MSSDFNPKVEAIEVSLIRQFNMKKRESTLDLGLGQMPFDPPQALRDAGAVSFSDDSLCYSPTAGLPELRQLLADKYAQDHGVSYDSNNIAITAGSEHALMCMLQALISEGDRVLVPEISFPAYSSIAYLFGAEVVLYRLDDQFLPDLDHIAELMNEPVKALVLNTPANPTGAVLSDESVMRLAELCNNANSDPWIISDEVYSQLNYVDDVASIDKYYDKTAVTSSISKQASAAGVRVGWVVAPMVFIDQILKLVQYSITSCPVPTQKAAIAYLADPAVVKGYVSELREHRDMVVEAFSDTALETVVPSGAFYYFARTESFGNSVSIAQRLLDNQDVLVIPGLAFGEAGDGYVRLSFAADKQALAEALSRIKNEFDL